MACSIGIGASASFILVLTRRTVPLHINVRLLLVSLAFAAIISCTVLLLIAIYGLVLTFSSLDSCRLLQSKSLCSLLRAPSSAAVYAMIIGNFIVGIERSIATVQYRTYEIQGSIQVGVGLLIVQWLVAVLIGLFERGVHEIVGFVHYCTAYVSDPSSAIPKLSGMVSAELIMQFSVKFKKLTS
uniref:G-protein coupled receptors family 1 profile domain-containing protein n=1 Tax=Plectus sambesii TaxID=2011161 RepID=A0A914WE05_9BILA